MVEIFGKSYYIDINSINEKCKVSPITTDKEGNNVIEIDIFLYEIIKMCLERVLNDYDNQDDDDDLSRFVKKEKSISFKIAFNTLIKNNILISEDENE